MSLREPKCDYCKHLIENDTKYMCKAFPDDIPAEKMWEDEQIECAPGIKFEEITD